MSYFHHFSRFVGISEHSEAVPISIDFLWPLTIEL